MDRGIETPYDARLRETRELLELYGRADAREIKRALLEALTEREQALQRRAADHCRRCGGQR
ncbi:hypothetical protein [Neobittarella massiliensis]|uniref:hypothetical protein n=1 Tax=Neobittarella massiliensis (ex Bilen et al. 2018) TaxID=2041842 RepID=UPI0013EC811F|nr:hypothetical protein [Neobittarella massiliensis]